MLPSFVFWKQKWVCLLLWHNLKVWVNETAKKNPHKKVFEISHACLFEAGCVLALSVCLYVSVSVFWEQIRTQTLTFKSVLCLTKTLNMSDVILFEYVSTTKPDTFLIDQFYVHKLTYTVVVYFDQHLCDAHSKRWLKYAFSLFFEQKSWKRKKCTETEAKFGKKSVFWNCTRALAKIYNM